MSRWPQSVLDGKGTPKPVLNQSSIKCGVGYLRKFAIFWLLRVIMIFSTKTFQHFATVPDKYTMSATISPTWQRQKKTTHFPCPDVCTPLCLYLHFSDLQTNQIFQYSIKYYLIGSQKKLGGDNGKLQKRSFFVTKFPWHPGFSTTEMISLAKPVILAFERSH